MTLSAQWTLVARYGWGVRPALVACAHGRQNAKHTRAVCALVGFDFLTEFAKKFRLVHAHVRELLKQARERFFFFLNSTRVLRSNSIVFRVRTVFVES